MAQETIEKRNAIMGKRDMEIIELKRALAQAQDEAKGAAAEKHERVRAEQAIADKLAQEYKNSGGEPPNDGSPQLRWLSAHVRARAIRGTHNSAHAPTTIKLAPMVRVPCLLRCAGPRWWRLRRSWKWRR